MKQITSKVPFFINKDNMQLLLKGRVIKNLDEVYASILFKIGKDIYEPRQVAGNEYASISDRVVAKAIKFVNGDKDNFLEIEIIDSLYWSKLKVPCIKINGYCIEEDDGIQITKVTRLSLADADPSEDVSMLL